MLQKMSVTVGDCTVTVCSDGSFMVEGEPIGTAPWIFLPGKVETEEGEIPFASASSVSMERIQNGVGNGIKVKLVLPAEKGDVSFELRFWRELSGEGDFYAEWIPISGALSQIKRVCWPGNAEFSEVRSDWYSLITLQQGLLLPNGWPEELSRLPFSGQLCSAAAYMPWFGQVKGKSGYIAVALTPEDAGYRCIHPAGGDCSLSFYWLPILGEMSGVRRIRYSFRNNCDYNTLAKIYRKYVRETGLLRTLAEKAAANPSVDRLIGAGFVHTGIKTHVDPESDFYDPDAPDKNNHLTTFDTRADEILAYKQLGVDRLYLHLDGWAEPGYDNCHPDYLPACREAGGWEGLLRLQKTIEDCGYLYGLHDQYRDFYHHAPSYDPAFSLQSADGSIFTMARWAGGPQDYLCASQALSFIRRNFSCLSENGVHPDGSYLDVFTCNEPDECANPAHPMTRSDCLRERLHCFSWLTAQGILPSSEEVSDWSVPQLVFCHYAPYAFMMEAYGAPKKGIPVPLFNLVYHDCLIIPWPMEKYPGEDYKLYALLNAGAAYLQRDPAYPGIDGAFGSNQQRMESVARWKEVSALQRKAAKLEMVLHRFLSDDFSRQQTVFSNGKKTLTVTVDFTADRYEIREEENEA